MEWLRQSATALGLLSEEEDEDGNVKEGWLESERSPPRPGFLLRLARLLPLTLALTVCAEKGGFRHNWLKRYFVLDREKLVYREGKNAGSSIKGTIAVDSIVEARASVSPTLRP